MYSPALISRACSPSAALEKYSRGEGTGCWKQKGSLSGGTDYRVTLGTTQPPSDAPVLAMIMAPSGDAGVRTELQGHTWGDSPGKSQLCLGPEGRTKPGRQCYREAVHISTFGVSIMQVPWMSPTSIGGVIEVAKVR